jgi:predicted acylesterase/phospholipase RssA
VEERTENDWSLPEDECDLVMRGGVTSGAVYPSALMEIARRYTLRNLGGASAGAIAAVAAAACEYGRNENPAAFARLEQVTEEITTEGFVLDLFQPKKETKLVFDIGLEAVSSQSESYSRRLVRAGMGLLRRRTHSLVQGGIALAAWVAAVVVVAVALAGGPAWLGIVGLSLLAVLALVGIVLLVVALAVRSFALDLNHALVGGGFGLCRGLSEKGYPDGSGLTDWLYKTIQACAGLGVGDEPLTFSDLQGGDPDSPLVRLQLVTTDLSASRPVVFPLSQAAPNERSFLFEATEFRRLFPERVVEHLLEGAKEVSRTPDGRPLYALPGLELPVVVAARLSLSFPVLLETVPLWKEDGPNGEPVRHTMSDGGISSNFPIHFFDSLLPGRPTFGLDLQPLRGSAKRVEMSRDPRPPLLTDVSDLATFGMQVVNASRNWRDNMQAELLGYRDRVCQIRLGKHEGGLNLGMGDEVLEGLVATGREAGRLVVRNSSAEWWDEHRLTRYRMLMQSLQVGLGSKGVGRDCVYTRGTNCGRRVPFRDLLEACANGTSTLPGATAAWCQSAMPASDVWIAEARRLGPGAAIDFDDADAPRPRPAMRIVPTV